MEFVIFCLGALLYGIDFVAIGKSKAYTVEGGSAIICRCRLAWFVNIVRILGLSSILRNVGHYSVKNKN